MKTIEKDELYNHLSQFLKNRGIEMKDGSYSQRIQQGCSLLTEAVNLTQQGMQKAKGQIDKRLDQMRQVIHEKTAPKPAATAPPPTSSSSASAGPAGSASGNAAPKARARSKRAAGKARPKKTVKKS